MLYEEKIRELERIVAEQENDVVLLLRRVAEAERERDEALVARDDARDVAVAFQQAATKLADDLEEMMPFVREHLP